MFYLRSSGFLCTTFRALAKWNNIRTHFRIITAVIPKGKRCITSPLHSTHNFFLYQDKTDYLFIIGFFFFQARSTATIFAKVCDVFPLLPPSPKKKKKKKAMTIRATAFLLMPTMFQKLRALACISRQFDF